VGSFDFGRDQSLLPNYIFDEKTYVKGSGSKFPVLMFIKQ